MNGVRPYTGNIFFYAQNSWTRVEMQIKSTVTLFIRSGIIIDFTYISANLVTTRFVNDNCVGANTKSAVYSSSDVRVY